MISENEILTELKKINRHLEKQNSSFKNVGRAFSAGMFNALGSIFGTAIVAALIIYILSRLSFTQNLTKSLQDFTQKYSPSVQLSVPSPDQP